MATNSNSSLFKSKIVYTDERKLRGGYYTPSKLVTFLTKWAVRSSEDKILEPGCGNGNFVVAAIDQLELIPKSKVPIVPHITAVEIEPGEIEAAKQRLEAYNLDTSEINWINDDFFLAYESLSQEEFDVILGNPPFIRFQYFKNESRDIAFSHLREAGYSPTKLANTWAAFVQLSIELLADGGRLAMVVPAELLQVKYAAELRKEIAKQFEHVVLIGFRKLVFPEIQQEVLLLLAEGKCNGNGSISDIHTIELEDDSHLEGIDDMTEALSHSAAKHSRNGMKWTALFLSSKSFDALDKVERNVEWPRLSHFSEINVGIVTGRNSFFLLSDKKREEIDATDYTVPLVGRTSSLPSLAFRDIDYESYVKDGRPAYLLDLNNHEPSKFPKKLTEYIKLGEDEGVNNGYKCRIRKRWFDVPSIYFPEGFMYRQIHKYPLLVINEAKVTSTDTIHRVRINSDVDPYLLAVLFFNSFSFAWAEVSGRSYGGGVLELEPKEAMELPIPYDEDIQIDFEFVNSLIQRGQIYEALDHVDQIVLSDTFGISKSNIRKVRKAWEELRDRRINRRG